MASPGELHRGLGGGGGAFIDPLMQPGGACSRQVNGPEVSAVVCGSLEITAQLGHIQLGARHDEPVQTIEGASWVIYGRWKPTLPQQSL